ncbi:MAG TPA: ABC transporter permease [Desulfitobacteriaceae bacterium]|jgi:oligopeptide transport system permease protein|nr:ABC transporter permease [Desulfitobacteriaceae bacterium]
MDIRPDSFSSLQQAPENELSNETHMTIGQNTWRLFLKNHLATAGLFILVLITLFSLIGPLFSRFDYFTNNLNTTNLSPNWIHPFGTDELGRDLLSRIMYGTRISLLIGFGSVLINLTIGIFYGGISGYLGGRIDNIMQRIIDIIFCIPDLLYIILLMVTFGAGLQNIFIVLGLINWVPMARTVRGQILTLREQEFILAARTLGASKRRILLKHLFPNMIGPIIIVAALQIPTAIFMEAFLSFIGLGIQSPLVSLGSLTANGRMNIPSYPFALIFPSITLALLILAFNFVGDGLRDAFDPKMPK